MDHDDVAALERRPARSPVNDDKRLTIAAVASSPELVTMPLAAPHAEGAMLRPLRTDDVATLAELLESLSPATRRRWNLATYDLAMARELCDAIGRYDKLRLVIVEDRRDDAPLLGLMELSFSTPPGDVARYRGHGAPLDGDAVARFGPCLRDDRQGTGLASAAMPRVLDVAKRFGATRMILWGGVLAENAPAIAFYERWGFRRVGTFEDPTTGLPSVDMQRPL